MPRETYSYSKIAVPNKDAIIESVVLIAIFWVGYDLVSYLLHVI